MNKLVGRNIMHLSGLFMLAMAFVFTAMQPSHQPQPPAAADGWSKVLADRLPLYGHRNWIVIADSAYPAQSSPGIETIDTGADQLEVVNQVLAALSSTKHVKPIIYTDAEMKHVSEADAPGIDAYRASLSAMLKGQPVQVLPHEQIISKLDESGKSFRVLILKTRLTVPYTSVFFQLDCAYWDADKEKRLRAAMEKAASN